MSSRSRSTLFSLLIGFVAFNAGYLLAESPIAPISLFGPKSTTPDEASEQFNAFWEVWDLAHNRFFDQPLDNDRLVEGAIDGMLAALDDPHTRYLSPEDEAEAREDMDGSFQGIGAEVEEVDGDVIIVSPIDGSPAQAAGLLPGDILRQADGIDLAGMSLDKVVTLVRGPAGEAIRLQIEREGVLFDVELIRDVIKLASVRSEMLEEGIAYVRLSRFGSSTDQELEDTLEKLLDSQPQGLILDLRRNPGGSLDTVVRIADLLLPEGPILVERFGDGRERVLESSREGMAEEIPMVVLVDEGSASASEVLAGAIQDRGRGILIGQQTFGKGTVQTWHRLSNGGGVRITVARWLTPNQSWIHEQGLTPDYMVKLLDGTAGQGDEQDRQLQAAISYLLGRPMDGFLDSVE